MIVTLPGPIFEISSRLRAAMMHFLTSPDASKLVHACRTLAHGVHVLRGHCQKIRTADWIANLS